MALLPKIVCGIGHRQERQWISSLQQLNQSYGYLWWLNGKASYMLPGIQLVLPVSWAPDAPTDMFAAMGKNGQMLCIVPSQGLVMVRMGNPGNSPLSEIGVFLCNMIWQKLNAVTSTSTSTRDNILLTNEIRVYPNPSDGIITVEGYEGAAEIINLNGTRLWSGYIKNNEPLNLQGLGNGTFLLKTGMATVDFMISE